MNNRLVTVAELRSTDERSRLCLRNIPSGEGQDFHSLSLERLVADSWVVELCITRSLFEEGCPNERWISDLHSFTPSTRRAIVQVAEGDRPAGTWSVSYGYSWRRWDLAGNVELARLKDCTSPFERL
jgi:hypothetical protein